MPDPSALNRVAQLLQAAHLALKQADVSRAIELYREILAFRPRHGLANYWLGVLAFKSSNLSEAIRHLEVAAQNLPKVPDVHIDLGAAYRALGQETAARESFKTARAVAPHYATEQLKLVGQLEKDKLFVEAIEGCRRGLLLFPHHPQLWQKFSSLLIRTQRWAEALTAWRDELAAKPGCPATKVTFGQCCFEAGDFALAAESFRAAIDLDPALTSAHVNLGLTLQKLGQKEEAVGCFEKAASLEPNRAAVHKGLGDALRDLGRWDEAVRVWKKAVELKPGYADAWQNLGLGFEHQDRLDEALACHQRVVELRPNNATAHRYLGMILQDRGELAAADKAYRRAKELSPKDPETSWQIFSLMAARGEFPQAWPDYEWRWKMKKGTTPNRNFRQPRWNGEDLNGRAILLHAEQGFGDTIQAVRYVPLVHERGGRVLLWVPPGLVELARTVRGADQVFSELAPDAAFDLHSPLMSLPMVFQTALETIPRQVPYLRAPERSGPRFTLPQNGRLKVGLVWSGSRSQSNDRRPVPLEFFRPLLQLDGIDFYSLQLGEAMSDLARCRVADRVVDLSGELTDFAATAAIVEQLDLVLTIDTAMAHLAGALGKTVWVLLSFSPDWRWLLDREDNPWYPTMRLFRQAKPQTWPEVFDRVEQALHDLARRHAERLCRTDASEARSASGAAAGEGPPAVRELAGHREGGQPAPSAFARDPLFAKALAQHQSGQLPAAAALYDEILKQHPDHAEAWRFLGVLRHQQMRLDSARDCLEQSLALQPASAFAHHDLGSVWFDLGQYEKAAASFRRALELQARFPEALYNLGNAFYRLKRRAKAKDAYERAIEQQPDLAEARFNLGILCQEQGQAEAAIRHYQDTLNLQPQRLDVRLNLALAFKDAARREEAAQQLQAILEADPRHVQAKVNLASLLASQGDLKQAEQLCREVLADHSSLPEAWLNLGVIVQGQGDPAKGIECFQRALQLQPGYADAEYNLGIAELLLGQFDPGWDHYEARWRTANPIFAPRKLKAPRWKGENLAGRRLLVYAEQGLGDAIQMARFLPILAERGALVILECPKPLQRLLQKLPGLSRVVLRDEPPPECDLRVPLLSLPALLKIGLGDLPGKVPYLRVPSGVDFQLPSAGRGSIKVGIVWAGRPTHDNDRNRSLALEPLRQVFSGFELALYSLQTGKARRQLPQNAAPQQEDPGLLGVERSGPSSAPGKGQGGKRPENVPSRPLEGGEGRGEAVSHPSRDSAYIIDLAPHLTDFAVTAAALEQLDLIVTVDTAVAHLAGALARPVWVLLPFAPDWRWMLHRSDSPWYPTMKLFRQPEPDDWTSVLEQVRRGLADWVSHRK